MKITAIAVATLSLLASHAFAAPSQYTLTVEPYQAESHFNYQIDSSAGNPIYGSPTSELDFKGMHSSGVTLSLDVDDGGSYQTLSLSLAKGGGSDGTMIDDDYFTQDYVGAGNPTRFSRTLSNSKMNDSFEIAWSGGWAFRPNNAYVTNARLGFGFAFAQYQFEATGLTILEDPYAMYGSNKTLFSSGESVITIKSEQMLSSLDVMLNKEFGNGFALKTKASAIYLGFNQSQDDHLKRTDLGSPSIKLTSINYGLKAAIDASYTYNSIVFSLGANYLYTAPYNDNGTAEFFDANDKSIGGSKLLSHKFEQLSYHAGIGYRF
ncbi:hypothetical protein D3C87_347740 [compost metagenome]